MPQMAPMNWTLLFLMFLCIYLVSMVLIYFSFKSASSNLNLNYLDLKVEYTTWKW